MARREQEIESLKNAYVIFDETQFAEAGVQILAQKYKTKKSCTPRMPPTVIAKLSDLLFDLFSMYFLAFIRYRVDQKPAQ